MGVLGDIGLGRVRVLCRVFMGLCVCRGDLIQYWAGVWVVDRAGR